MILKTSKVTSSFRMKLFDKVDTPEDTSYITLLELTYP